MSDLSKKGLLEKLRELIERIDHALKNKNYNLVLDLCEEVFPIEKSVSLAYRGLVEFQLENYLSAEKLFLESYKINPKQSLAIANLLPTYIKLRNFKNAIVFGELYFTLGIKGADSVKMNLATAYQQEQRYEDAIKILENIDEAKLSSNITALSVLVTSYRAIFDFDNGQKYLNIAKAVFPDNIELNKLEADFLADTDPSASIKLYEKSIALKPNNLLALKWNMSLMLLRSGDFSRGWKYYDFGLRDEIGKIGRPIPHMLRPFRIFTDIHRLNKDKWTIISSEQGIGDQVLFLSSLHEFLRSYPKSILLCEKRMQPILQRSFPGLTVSVYGLGKLINPRNIDINGVLPIGSIQKFFRKSRNDYINNQRIFLTPNLDLTKAYREKLLHLANGRKIVGISWKGGFWERSIRLKTIQLYDWLPLLSSKDYFYVCLQYGDVKTEKEWAFEHLKNLFFVEGIDFKKELDNWFSLIHACDSILSVSTAMVHFAAASGMHVDLLLSDRGNPFVWGLNDVKGIPYKDVAIHRKLKNESMGQFMERLKGVL